MRNIVILFILILQITGQAYSQPGAVQGYPAPFTVNVTGETGSDRLSGTDLTEYSIGGHLFAGQYPINNPLSTGDTGIVYLYRTDNNIVTPVDTATFFDLGYYLFPKVLAGSYLLKARLTRNSVHSGNYFPTYYTSDTRWNTSATLEITDRNNFEANIYLIPTTDYLKGPASIKGFVVQATSEQGVETMKNTEVILFNDKMEALTYNISSTSGMFFFPDLPYGTYNLIAESTGKYPALLRITVDQNHTDFDSVLVEALTHNPATIEELGDASMPDLGPVFPNPASDNINVVIRTTEPEYLNVAVYSVQSCEIVSYDCLVAGMRSLSIPIGSLPGGTYFLLVRKNEGHWKQVQKFIKR